MSDYKRHVRDDLIDQTVSIIAKQKIEGSYDQNDESDPFFELYDEVAGSLLDLYIDCLNCDETDDLGEDHPRSTTTAFEAHKEQILDYFDKNIYYPANYIVEYQLRQLVRK